MSKEMKTYILKGLLALGLLGLIFLPVRVGTQEDGFPHFLLGLSLLFKDSANSFSNPYFVAYFICAIIGLLDIAVIVAAIVIKMDLLHLGSLIVGIALALATVVILYLSAGTKYSLSKMLMYLPFMAVAALLAVPSIIMLVKFLKKR